MPNEIRTTRETEQQRLGAFFALGGFPRVPPHDEPAACREAWLRGYDEAATSRTTQRQRWELRAYDWLYCQPKGKREQQFAITAAVLFLVLALLMWLSWR